MKYTVLRFFGSFFYWTTWPLLYILVPLSRRVRIIVKVNDEILLVEGLHGNGDYMMPGGGIKKNESEEQAALRELYEETYIKLRNSNLRHICNIDHRRNGVLSHLVVYELVLLEKPNVTSARDFEIVNYKWVSIRELQKTKRISTEVTYIMQKYDKI